MRRVTLLFSLIVIAMVTCGNLLADTIVMSSTPTGATAGGESVDAQAVFTLKSGEVDVQLTNLIANIHDAGQLLTDLSFTLSNGNEGSESLLGTSIGTLVTVDGSGKVTADGTQSPPDWGVSGSGSSGGTILLSWFNRPIHGKAPDTLLPGPCTTGTVDSSANSSIAGNSGHYRFLCGTVDFNIGVPDLSSDATVSDVIFSFSTTEGVDVSGTPPTSVVPEPASFALFGTGLLALAFFIRRKHTQDAA